MITQPHSVYINWAAYDELSDTVELTEELAMRELDELLRLRRAGVRFDYYVMDCFWFARDGGYRTWRKPHWPNGPEAWLTRCLENGVRPGLWVASDASSRMDYIPAWADSYNRRKSAMCSFAGDFLPDFISMMTYWVERGVELFKFDFAEFAAAPPHLEEALLPSEIRAANITAFQGALKAFRKLHPHVMLLAYNGFSEGSTGENTLSVPLKTVDSGWLECFDSLYCGDPRLSDVPMMNFWRSKDLYSDHMVRYYEFNGIPLSRIDNTAFMIGTTGTCYYRGAAAWKGMLLLSLARGGWMNTYYGNLELLSDEDGEWFAQAQNLFYPLQADALFQTFGPMPGAGKPFGYTAFRGENGLITVVNPSQETLSVPLSASGPMRLLFCDAGFAPVLSEGMVTLGAEQMAVIGVGSYAEPRYDLGSSPDVLIPAGIDKLDTAFTPDGEKAITATLTAPTLGRLRVIMRQLKPDGMPQRTTSGSPPKQVSLGRILTIQAFQNDREVPVTIAYDKIIWSGLSWAVGEVDSADLTPGQSVTVRCASTEPAAVTLTGEVYRVEY